jgi:multidrug efflux pump subunit AcrA (membrane-fusion protein)
VTAEQVVKLRVGDNIRVEFPELPEELLVGTIDRIVPVADPQTRTYPVYVQLTNRLQDKRPLLMSGMLARAHFPAGNREPSALVPKDALVLNGRDRSVFVFQGEASLGQGQASGVVRKVPVELGVAVDGLIQVRGDLNESDLVVVTGNERLVDGAEVSVVKVNEYAAPQASSAN